MTNPWAELAPAHVKPRPTHHQYGVNQDGTQWRIIIVNILHFCIRYSYFSDHTSGQLLRAL